MSFAAVLLLIWTTGNVAAPPYPTKPIRLIVTYPPGGNPDYIARYIGNELSNALGQPIVVENRTGANGTIGAHLVAQADPDGYTLLLATDGPLAIPKIADLPYDPLKDFTPIANVAATDFVLLANPALSVSSVKELVAVLKSRPEKINYASAGVGSPHHLAMELFKSLSGTAIVHVPYRGGSAVLPALMANEVSLMFNGIGPALPFMKSKQLNALATTGNQRNSLSPQLPTMMELGFPDFEIRVWFGIFAPAGTPQQIVEKLNAEIAQITNKPTVREKLAQQGLDTLFGSPQQSVAFFRTHRARWQRIWEITELSQSKVGRKP